MDKTVEDNPTLGFMEQTLSAKTTPIAANLGIGLRKIWTETKIGTVYNLLREIEAVTENTERQQLGHCVDCYLEIIDGQLRKMLRTLTTQIVE